MAILLSSKVKIAIFIALIIAAFGAYYNFIPSYYPAEDISFNDTQNLQSISTFPKTSQPTSKIGSVDALLIGLKQRLGREADDVDGWVLLSKSYYHLNRLNEATEAFEKARALGYIGNWKPLPQISSASEAKFSPANTTSLSSSGDTSASGNQVQITIPDEEGISSPDEAGSPGIKLKVSLEPGLMNELPPESSVFIFARSVNNPGPPLAVLRKKVGELPLEVTLNDSHAMIPGRTISNANHIVVGARVSISGNPTKQKGDFERLSNSISSDFEKVVELVIKNKI